MRLRSLLYVPAHSTRFLASADTRGADALILDLEDSVPADQKQLAREGLAHWVPKLSRTVPVLVRINADHMREDALQAARAGAVGLLVPKVESPDQITAISAAFTDAGLPPLPLLAIIESPAALLAVSRIAATPHLMGLALGGEDFALAMGAEPLPEVLTPPKLTVHYAAKAHGLRSFGLLRSVADYTDTAALQAAAKQARSHGFDGATCVHPSVVPILNAAFAPNADELAHARRLVAAMEVAHAEGKGATSFEGRMIDAPVLARARALLEGHNNG